MTDTTLLSMGNIQIGDTAIFTLYNGDRTNIMSLESPSTKLKYEFINRIAISLMGREGKQSFFLSPCSIEKSQARVSFSSLTTFVIAFCRALEAERDAFAETKP